GKFITDFDIAINNNNIPVISYINYTDADLTAAIGNANNATSFTLHDVDTSVITTSGQAGSSIAVDSEGNIWIAYTDFGIIPDSPPIVSLAKHVGGAAWSEWTSSNISEDSSMEPSIAISGN